MSPSLFLSLINLRCLFVLIPHIPQRRTLRGGKEGEELEAGMPPCFSAAKRRWRPASAIPGGHTHGTDGQPPARGWIRGRDALFPGS